MASTSSVARCNLLATLQATLARQGTHVVYLDLRKGSEALPLALEDAESFFETESNSKLLALEDQVDSPSRLLALEDKARCLALRDIDRPLALEDMARVSNLMELPQPESSRELAIRNPETVLHHRRRNQNYKASTEDGAACAILALPAAARFGSDAHTALLAYRHTVVPGISPAASVEQMRAAYSMHRLFERLEFDLNMFEPRWDFDFSVSPFSDLDFRVECQVRGGFPYNRPLGWKRFALKVTEVFEDVHWLANDGRSGEWAIAYHGTSAFAARPIATQGLRAGGSSLERRHGAMFGVGVYCAPHVEHAAFFAEVVPVPNGESINYFQVVFQCRVQPGRFEVHNDGLGDIYVVKSEACIRPYAILLGDCNAEGEPTLKCREWP